MDNKARDSFLERLVTLNPRLSSNQEKSEKKLSLLTKQWQEGQIESFDYLMQINQLGMASNILSILTIFVPVILKNGNFKRLSQSSSYLESE